LSISDHVLFHGRHEIRVLLYIGGAFFVFVAAFLDVNR
jgi:hypothetical protein